jgi:hypothetical protein
VPHGTTAFFDVDFFVEVDVAAFVVGFFAVPVAVFLVVFAVAFTVVFVLVFFDVVVFFTVIGTRFAALANTVSSDAVLSQSDCAKYE